MNKLMAASLIVVCVLWVGALGLNVESILLLYDPRYAEPRVGGLVFWLVFPGVMLCLTPLISFRLYHAGRKGAAATVTFASFFVWLLYFAWIAGLGMAMMGF